jgi:hypothetical protein
MGSSRPVSKQERGRRAMKAMKPLGFSSKLCSNVLRRLLELYDHRWALIEDDNYRVFAEAILDAQVPTPLPSFLAINPPVPNPLPSQNAFFLGRSSGQWQRGSAAGAGAGGDRRFPGRRRPIDLPRRRRHPRGPPRPSLASTLLSHSRTSRHYHGTGHLSSSRFASAG